MPDLRVHHDPNEGDHEGSIGSKVPFDHLPDDWVCPNCGGDQGDFEVVLERNKQPRIALCQEKFPCFREDLRIPGIHRK
ncbi:MAG TPA: rubredoxin [Desulfobacteria bacterium]|nr:rubredoxin [Desulfobacteria bacterium]